MLLVQSSMFNVQCSRVNSAVLRKTNPVFASLLRRPRAAEALAEAQVARLRRLKGYAGQATKNENPKNQTFSTLISLLVK